MGLSWPCFALRGGQDKLISGGSFFLQPFPLMNRFHSKLWRSNSNSCKANRRCRVLHIQVIQREILRALSRILNHFIQSHLFLLKTFGSCFCLIQNLFPTAVPASMSTASLLPFIRQRGLIFKVMLMVCELSCTLTLHVGVILCFIFVLDVIYCKIYRVSDARRQLLGLFCDIS